MSDLGTKEGVVKENHILYAANAWDLHWDIEADVLVIGAGGCGLVASLAAAEKGAQVFIVEKEKAAARGETLDPLGRMEFGKHLEPPLYGAKATGALFHTQGGLKVNRKGEVIRKDGSSIPNLYAGGGTAVGFSGNAGPKGYLSANDLLAALVLGKISGEEAGGPALKRV